MVNKVAFIIPTYPPHFNYAKNFLDTFRKNYLNLQADLFFIFSNESEAQEFGEYEYKIILPDELRIFENGGIINIKKFFALKSLQNQYDYYIVLDSESEIIKNVDLYSICNSIYETKKLYGNTVWNFEHIGMCKIREQCKSHFICQQGQSWRIAAYFAEFASGTCFHSRPSHYFGRRIRSGYHNPQPNDDYRTCPGAFVPSVV